MQRIDELLLRDVALDDARHLLVQQRLAAGDRDHRRAALVDRVHALLERQALVEDLVRVVDLAAAGAREIAAEQRLEHQHERIALGAREFLLDEVRADAGRLDEGNGCHGSGCPARKEGACCAAIRSGGEGRSLTLVSDAGTRRRSITAHPILCHAPGNVRHRTILYHRALAGPRRPSGTGLSLPPTDPLREANALRRWIVAATAASATHAWVCVVVSMLLAIGAVTFVVGHVAIDTDSAKLIASDVPWRQRSAVFDAAFPQKTDLIAVVIDGATPEIAERAAAVLSERIAARTDLLRNVRRPDGGAFFDRNGLLFLDQAEVAKTTDQLVASQAVIGTLAADPSVRGLMDTLQLALEGVKRGETTLDVLGPGLHALADTLDGVEAGRPVPLSWRTMLGGRAAAARELRRFVLAQPMLDFSALQPGARASAFIRETARRPPDSTPRTACASA